MMMMMMMIIIIIIIILNNICRERTYGGAGSQTDYVSVTSHVISAN
jgi:ABC-type cobalt transport system substrate-binding protein